MKNNPRADFPRYTELSGQSEHLPVDPSEQRDTVVQESLYENVLHVVSEQRWKIVFPPEAEQYSRMLPDSELPP